MCTGLAAAARIDHSEKHRSPTRNAPRPRAFRGTDAKECPVFYAADDLKRVRFITRAQALGFSLEEIALLLGLSDGEHGAETKALAEKKLAMVEEKLGDLAAIQKALRGLVNECSKGSRKSGCPIIDALAAER